MIESRLKSADSSVAKFSSAASSERWKRNGGLFSVGFGWRRVSTTTSTRFDGQTGGPGSKKVAAFSDWFCKKEFCWRGGAWLTAKQDCGRSVRSAGGKGAVGNLVAWSGVVADPRFTIGKVTSSEMDLLIIFGLAAGTNFSGVLLGCGRTSLWQGTVSTF